MCVVPVMPPQTAPLFIFPGLFQPIQPIPLDNYIPYQPVVMQNMAQGFRVPAMFANGSQSITIDLPSPPTGDGDGVGGSNGSQNGGRRREVYLDLVNALRAEIPKMRTTGELISRIDADVDRCSDVEERLSYLNQTGIIIEKFESKFGPGGIIEVVHHIMMRARDLSNTLDVANRRSRDRNYLHDHLRPLFRLVDEMERNILETGGFTHEIKGMIASIHLIFGTTGYYSQVVAGDENNILPLIKTILVVLDCIKRFNILGMGVEAQEARTFLEQLRRQHELPEDHRAWAIFHITNIINKNVQAAALWTDDDDKDILDQMLDNISAGWVSAMEGIYLFAPSVFRMIAAAFTGYGFKEFAAKFSGRATWTEKVAIGLSLTE